MRRFAMSMAAVVVGLAVASSAQAGKGSGGNGGGQSNGGSHPHSGGSGHNGSFIKNHSSGPSQQVHQIHNNKQVFHDKKFVPSGQSFLGQHAQKHSFGYCFQGKHHCHWTYSCWSPKYGCTTYWCPYACCYYYWCAPHCCYYPVSYCPTGLYCY